MADRRLRLNALRVLLPAMLLAAMADVDQGEPPWVAGIGIGSTTAAVRSRLGSPDRQEESLGLRFWEYSKRALTVIWRDDTTGVQGIVVRGQAAGSLGGIQVGDATSSLQQRWGVPTRVRQDGRYMDFVGNRWVLSAEVAGGHVVSLTLFAAANEKR